MGGHGGLNILPQKKWNVYNHDNRAIVDRDKKLAEEKNRKKYQQERQDQLDGKIEVLKMERGIKADEERAKREQKDSLVNSLNQEFKSLNELKHINLFENEQKILENRELFQIKRLKQQQFLKDKNMDYSSKFLGSYAQSSKKSPWYVRGKGFVEQKKKTVEIEGLLSVKKSDSHTIRQVINLEKKEKEKGKEDERYQRSRQKYNEQKKQKMKEAPKSQLEMLRQKRMRRQQKQRERAAKIKLMNGKS